MQAPDEFEEQMKLLFAAIDKPLGDVKVEAFRVGLKNMSLPTLSRSVRLLIEEMEQSEPPKSFSVSNIWSASKRLRARAPEPKASIEPPDPWAEAGNLHLLAHCRAHPEKLKQYGQRASAASMQKPAPEEKNKGKDRGWDGPVFGDASYDYIMNIQKMVKAKNSWVADMKDLDRGDGVPPELQKRIWDDYVLGAERSNLEVNNLSEGRAVSV